VPDAEPERVVASAEPVTDYLASAIPDRDTEPRADANGARADARADHPPRDRLTEMINAVRAAAVLMTAALLTSACGSSVTTAPKAPAKHPTVLPALPAVPAGLPMATTFSSIPAAPRDPQPFRPETGIVLHPTAVQAVYAAPGGRAVAALPVTELGSPTYVPVVQSASGWDRVLLPSRPDGSTGWLRLSGALQAARTGYVVTISLVGYRLTVTDAGRRLGSWTVAEGAPGTPTPAGRTFILASLRPAHPTYSPLILPLGTHSDTLDTFGGGPGTVALHGWPDSSVFGHAVSHGCVRVPAGALRVLSRVPLGSSVIIDG
jgi:lipoprotein-anchoring transpeptidase ErfK/SrfK